MDVYVEDGTARVLCISRSDKIQDNDKFIIFRAIWPAPIPNLLEMQIHEIAQHIAEAFNIRNSPMLIQCLTNGRKAFVIEFSARTGGGVKYLLIRRTSGFDVIKAVVDLTLGEYPHVTDIFPEQKYLVNDCKPGIFDHLEGFEKLASEGYLKDYYLFKWKAASFDQIKASGDRVAGYTVTGDTAQELINKHNEVRNRIKVVSTNGEDIARHDLLIGLRCENGYLFSEFEKS